MLVELSVVQQRYDAVMEVLKEGIEVTDFARRYGVSRQSVHAWIRRYEESGLGGLTDRSHRPKSCPHQIDATVEALICELRRAHPWWGPKTLVHQLRRRGVDPPPARATVYRVLVRNRLVEARRRRRARSDYRRWERDLPMALWQSDIMGVVKLAGGRKLRVITALDDHSRFCVIAKLVSRPTSKAVCAAFEAALDTYGAPDEVLTDNGSQFTARFTSRASEAAFDRLCRVHGIRHILTSVGSPTTTGKIERFHQTLRKELFTRSRFASLEEAQAALDRYVAAYNNERPHQALDMAVPSERFVPRTPVKTVSAPSPEEVPADVTTREVRRRVTGVNKMCVANQRFSVPSWLSGKVVTVRVERNVFHVLFKGELVKSVRRTNHKEVIVNKESRRQKA